MSANAPHTLDPSNWPELRQQGHRMLDDMLDYLQDIRARPVWQPMPGHVRARLHQPVPGVSSDLIEVHNTFMRDILPFALGNTHPGFLGWVHGGGTPVGMLADMLAAGLNANLGGRDHAPIEVERQVLEWVREWFGFPEGATGLFVTGSSMASFISVLVARTAALGTDVRRLGVGASDQRLTAYASAAVHGCIAQALDIAGLGSDALRIIPVNGRHEMDIASLEREIAADRRRGRTPFLVVGTAGTVGVGAVDNLTALADIASRERIAFHVDGACGALGVLAQDIAPRLAGIERADSIAFDFHKWGQVPYDAGFVLVRNGEWHRKTFSSSQAYLARNTRGMAAGSPWPCDLGPDLSRGFRALKTWFTLNVYGAKKLGQVVSGTCALARHLGDCIARTPQLELLAPISLNIVCFRYVANDSDRVNADIVTALQEMGIAAPSTTVVDGRLAIRAAIVNHRTTAADLDQLVAATVALGDARANSWDKAS